MTSDGTRGAVYLLAEVVTVSETICIRSLHSRVFIPVGSYMTNTTIRVSKGIHNIAFTVSPDSFHTQVPK